MMSAVRATVKFADGTEDGFSLGKIVLPWPKRVKRERDRSRSAGEGGSRSRSRSRGRKRKEEKEDRNRSRTPDRHDWTYYKGTRQSELVEKWRAQEKEKALSSGRDRRNTDGYVPNVFRPVPRSGKHGSGKTDQEIADEAAIAEQLEERARREKEEKMAAIFSKYSGGGGGGSTSAKPSDDADVVRLG